MSEETIFFERVGQYVRLTEVANPGALDDCVEISIERWNEIVDEWIAETRTPDTGKVSVSRECALQAYTTMECTPVLIDNQTDEFKSAFNELVQALQEQS